MCGFVGFTGGLAQRGESPSGNDGRHNTQRPDSAGTYIDDDIALGFRRLSIIDLDSGSQPMYNENRDMVIVFNGEIYNYKELRDELIKKAMFSPTTRIRKCLYMAMRSTERNCSQS